MAGVRHCGKIKYLGAGSSCQDFRDALIEFHLENGQPVAQTYLRCNPGSVYKRTSLDGAAPSLKPNRLIIAKDNPHWELHISPSSGSPVNTLNNIYKDLCELLADKGKTPFQNRAEVGVKRKLSITPSPKGETLVNTGSSSLGLSAIANTPKKALAIDRERTFKRQRVSDDESSSEEESKENRKPQSGEKQNQNTDSDITTCKPLTFYGKSSSNSVHFGPIPRSGSALISPGKPTRLSSGIKSVAFSRFVNETTSPVVKSNGSNPSIGKHQLGFVNLGNTCFMNSILQSLFGLQTFEADLSSFCRLYKNRLPSNTLAVRLAKLMTRRLGDQTEVENLLRGVKDVISKTEKRFSGYQQQDAHEFLVLVLDQLKEEAIKVTEEPAREQVAVNPAGDNATSYVAVNPAGDNATSFTYSRSVSLASPAFQHNPVCTNFDFELTISLQCLSCSNITKTTHCNNYLSVPLPKCSQMCTTQDALDCGLKNEEVQFTCEKCSHTKALMTHKFSRLPRVLILQLQRYENRGNKRQEKIKLLRHVTLGDYCDNITVPHYPYKIQCLSSPLKLPETPLQRSQVKLGLRSLTDSDRRQKSGGDLEQRRREGHPKSKAARRLLQMDDEKEPMNPEEAASAEIDGQLPNKTSKNGIVQTSQEVTQAVSLDDGFDSAQLQEALQMSLDAYNSVYTKENGDHGYTSNDGTDGKGDIISEYRNLRMTEQEQLALALRQSVGEEVVPSTPLNTSPQSFTKIISHNAGRQKSSLLTKSETDVVFSPWKSSETKQTEETARDIVNSSDYFREGDKALAASPFGKEEEDSADAAMVGEEKKKKRGERADTDSHKNICHAKKNLLFENISPDHSGSKRSNSDSDYSCSKASGDVPALLSKTVGYVSSLRQIPDSSEKRLVDSEISPESSVEKYLENVSNDLEQLLVPEQDWPFLSQDSDELPDIVLKEKTVSEWTEKFQEDEEVTLRHHSVTPPKMDQTSKNKTMEKENQAPFTTEVSNSEDSLWDAEKRREYKKRITDIESGRLPFSYRLVSVINHLGISENAGHYSSDVFDITNNEWRNFDDKTVTKTNEGFVRTNRQSQGYMFMYLSNDIFEDLSSLRQGCDTSARNLSPFV